jgi:hypothetical protein
MACSGAPRRDGRDLANRIGVMTNSEPSAMAALTAVLTEANAQVCKSCGERAAVRVHPKQGAGADQMKTADPIVFCFECGHEERAVD